MGALDGKTIVVTGAGRGLGRAFAEACCAAGARVIVGELRDDLAAAAVADLTAQGFAAEALPLDVGEPDSVDAFAAAVRERAGRIDGLVNNAAIATGIGGKTFDEIDVDTFDRVLRVNVRGVWLVVKALVPLMDRGGGIVNLASDTALWGAPRLLHYVASKGAVISMTRSLARELGTKGIWVNALAVGLTKVEATEYVPAERHALYENGRAITRAQVPGDVVGSAVFLLSDAASFVTGQTLPVNGGFVFT
ncbi:SDR family oxidoreductase [Azospirillum sp. ST 5-10]|uniref:SDR family oxidoreductase n=1 Tax=unclassified Azospirillum TaxID=2630922 RepID=UPI003F49B51B